MKLFTQRISFKILSFFFANLVCSTLCYADNKAWENSVLEDLTQIFNQISLNEMNGTRDETYFYTGSNPRRKDFTAETIQQANNNLYTLDSLGRKTIIYVGYCWYEYEGISGKKLTNEQLKAYANQQIKKVDLIITELKTKNIIIENINLHVSLLMFVKTTTAEVIRAPSDKKPVWNWEIYVDRFYPRPDMNTNCRAEIKKEIINAIKNKNEGSMNKSPNAGIIWRAKLLKQKMKDCPLTPVITGNQSKDLIEMLNYVKSKVANNQQVLFHTDAAGKPTIGSMAGENLKIDNTTYSKIRFLNFATTDPSTADPLSYSTQYYEGTPPKSAFIFNDKDNKMLFSFTIFDEKAKEKKDSLRNYLFGAEENNPQNMHLSTKGLEFMKKQEGVVDHVYNDAKGGTSKYCTEHSDHNAINAKSECDKQNHYYDGIIGKPTIGLGHLITSQTELDDYCTRQPIDSDELWKLFEDKDKQKYEKIIKNSITRNLSQCQFDALYSFVFNTGTAGKKLKNLINSGEASEEDIKIAMLEWDTPSIIIDRRKDEVDLYNDCDYSFR